MSGNETEMGTDKVALKIGCKIKYTSDAKLPTVIIPYRADHGSHCSGVEQSSCMTPEWPQWHKPEINTVSY